jgi:hypothetical protein
MPCGYNFNLKLRALGRVPPFEAILGFFKKTPDIFTVNPNRLIVGLKNLPIQAAAKVHNRRW